MIVKMTPLIVRKIDKIVPYTYNLSEDRYEPTSNMNAEFMGVEIQTVLEDNTIGRSLILLPTRGQNECQGKELLIDLI